MLREAGIEVQVLSTERANHAYEYMLTCDLTGIDAVLTVGGDGILFEVINGLYMREDYKLMSHPTPVVPIPGGTGNGLSKSILYDCDEDFSALTATFVAIKGKPVPFDLSLVQTVNYTHYSFLILGWGLISDVDILSEKMRWMGEPRLYVAAVYFTLARRMYHGRLSLFTGLDIDDPLRSTTALSRTPENVAASQLPSLSTPIASGNGWTVIDSEFILVWVLQSSHCSSSVHSGPGVKLDDGLFTVIVATNLSRFEILQLLLAVEDGSHVNHEKVKVYKALSYRLEPSDTTRGLFSLDGELVEYGPIQASVLPSAARTLSLK
jgi:diacylglycerol kinase family enzyme